MESVEPAVLRRRILTNSAAEYVENGASMEVLRQLEESPEELEGLQTGLEFIQELDRFVPKGLVFEYVTPKKVSQLHITLLTSLHNHSPSQVYEESERSMEAFRQTLQRFVIVLKKRKIDKKLDITIKDPKDFTLDYVLDIVNRIRDNQEGATKTKTCKGFIRRCYNKVEANRGIVGNILTMIPSDIYGSVISGGCTLILAAVEKHADQRREIQTCLAQIPEQLERVERLSEIHRTSANLHHSADAVMVAVFGVLERIVDKITETWQVKLAEKTEGITKSIQSFPFRGKGHTAQVRPEGIAPDRDERKLKATVTDALADLQNRIERFQKEVDVCNGERLGRVEKGIGDIQRAIAFVWKQNKVSMTRQHEDIALTIKHCLTQTSPMVAACGEESRQLLFRHVADAAYRFCASNPLFNTKNGGIDVDELQRRQKEESATAQRTRQAKNSSMARKWATGLRIFLRSPRGDIRYSLGSVEMLDADEKNQSQYILQSQEFDGWIREDRSGIIAVDTQTAPDSLNNALSFTSALFAMTLLSTARYPVLAFFCSHRNIEIHSENESGPTALVTSLTAQLLRFVAHYRPSVDLSSAIQDGFLTRGKENLKVGLAFFIQLLSSLPEDDMVFIIIDSLSRIWGSQKNSDKVMKALCLFIKKTEKMRSGLILKVMVTDALPGSYIRNNADTSMHVPDLVEGFGQIDMDESSDAISRRVRGKSSVNDGEERPASTDDGDETSSGEEDSDSGDREDDSAKRENSDRDEE